VHVAVLGAGLQGVCVALELAQRGVSVDLVDQDARALNRASLRNEGKIHIGFVYAKDTTLATAEMMLDGALRFRPLLSRWTAGGFNRLARSHPFAYVVAHDSLVPAERLAEHYAKVEQACRERIEADASLDYLGERPEELWRRIDPARLDSVTSSGVAAAAFMTVEASIDLPATATLLRDAVAAAPAIRFRPGRRVLDVQRTASGFRVEGIETVPETAGYGIQRERTRSWTMSCDQVVNALWDGRLGIDSAIGLPPQRAWSHRLKYRVLVELPPTLRERPSMTIVLGPYGDIVVHPNGGGYVSWYPECLREWSKALIPPESWDAPCRGVVPEAEAAELARRALGAADRWIPGLAGSRPLTVDAGAIFAFGDTDITDPASGLHRRDIIGVRSVDGYHSVNTGKLTTAPMFAVDAADAVTGPAGGARAR
jgi:hypothetical protein